MDDLREFLKKAENQAREEMSNLNEALKHILLAQQLVDLEVEIPEDPPEEHPDPEQPMRSALIPDLALRKHGAEPTDLELKHSTRYKGLTLNTCIINVLKRMGEPVDSKKIHAQLVQGGWESNSKDSLGAVRNALVRLKHDIKSEKIEGIYHYALLPIKELV